LFVENEVDFFRPTANLINLSLEETKMIEIQKMMMEQAELIKALTAKQ
jgi:hypothetical protein